MVIKPKPTLPTETSTRLYKEQRALSQGLLLFLLCPPPLASGTACGEPHVLKILLTGRNSQQSPAAQQILQLLCCTHTQHCHMTVFMYVITFSLNNSRNGFRWKYFDSKGFSVAPERSEQMTFLAESAEAK